MKRWVPLLVILMLPVAGLVATARAQTGPPTTPVPPPVPAPKPSGPFLGAALGYPYDFTFHQQVFGSFFKPGERITITAQNISIQPQTVTADSAGSFSATVDFSWVFCGPRATTHPAPVIRATGNQGSSAALALSQPPCPELVSREHWSVEPGGGGVSPGGTVGVATAVAVGTVMPATPVSPPVGGPPQPLPPQQWPTPTPRLVKFDVQAFGFAPGEQVTIREINSPTGSAPAPTHAGADALGRFQISLQANVPGLCAGISPPPELQANGDKGTSVTSPLRWAEPLIACPVRGGPEPGNPDTPVPTHPPVPVPPNPGTGDVAPAISSSSLSVNLSPAVAHPGRMERAEISAAGLSVAHLTVRYPGRGRMHRTIHLDAAGAGRVQWRIPRNAGHGKARVQVRFDRGQISLTASFMVR